MSVVPISFKEIVEDIASLTSLPLTSLPQDTEDWKTLRELRPMIENVDNQKSRLRSTLANLAQAESQIDSLLIVEKNNYVPTLPSPSPFVKSTE